MRAWLQSMMAMIFAGLLLTAPAAAQDAEALQRRAEAISQAVESNELPKALQLIDAALADLPEPGLHRGLFLRMRGAVLSDLDRPTEALVAVEQAIAMLPEDDADLRFLLASLQVANGRGVDASRTIVHIADRFPERIKDLKLEAIGQLMRELDPKKEPDARFELALALTSRGIAGGEAPGAMDWLKAEAIVGLLRRDRVDEARPLVSGLIDASTLIEMLVDNQYRPIWPEIEAKAGLGGARAIASELAAVDAVRKADPANLKLTSGYLRALRGAGRARDAAAIDVPIAGDLAAIEKAGEDAFWLVNARADALAETGRVDEGDKLFARLLTLGLQKHPELISMAINRSALLLDYDRPAEALAAAAFAEAQGKDAASDYGHMWSWQVETCALTALGRPGEAKSALARIVPMKSKNYAAYTLALLCHGRLDDVEKVVLERLSDPAERGAMLIALQDFRSGPNATAGSRMRDKLLQVRDRPAIRKAISSAGRILSIEADRTYWGSF